jgi:NIPSNAP
MPNSPLACEVRYRVYPDRMSEFEAYAQIWVKLIERHGGKHHGYFMPREKPVDAKVSFSGVGNEGTTDIAVALFSFPDEQAYAKYRAKVATDPDGIAANARFGGNPPFISYERTFLTPLPREAIQPPAREL